MTSEWQTFSGSREALMRELLGPQPTELLDDDAAMEVLDFMASRGATIRPLEDHSDTLEVRLGGPLFVSVHKFLWSSIAAILGLAVGIVGGGVNAIPAASELVRNLLSSLSIFPEESTEFKAYSAIAASQETNPRKEVTLATISSWLEEQGQLVAHDELLRALTVLSDRQLVKQVAEDRFRIVW